MTCKNCQHDCEKDFCSQRCRNCFNVKHWQSVNGIKRKQELIDLLGGKCKNCGYDKNLAGLCFHHLDPNVKEFGISMRELTNTSMLRLKEEVEKCILLCHNCHMELHYPHLQKTSL
jgi:hypothetical protein